jgi:hypothetical protein
MRKLVLNGLVILGVANFLIFAAIAIAIGGDAYNGKIENGHFFLGNHGRFTEVSQATFNYSLAHVRSLFVTHPVAALAWLIDRAGRGKRIGRL